MSRENPFLSCIVPAYNEADNIPHFIPALAKNLSELGVRYETHSQPCSRFWINTR
jgi:uncharacterized protein YqgV (UPF0045/DUF77 family)